MKEKPSFRIFFLAAAFLILTFFVAKQVMRPIDLSVTQWVQGFWFKDLDYVMSVFTLLGSIEFSSFAILVVTWYWYRKHEWPGAFLYLFLFMAFGLVELVLKHLVAYTEPGLEFNRNPIRWGLMSVSTPYSFPSGHTFRSVFLFGMCYQWISRNGIRLSWKLAVQKVLLIGVIFVVCFSRIYLGDHWLSDVIGGFLLAILALLLASETPHPELRPA